MRRIIDLARRLVASRTGNAMMIFSLAIPAMFGTAGLAIDFSRMHSAKLAAQSAMDTALLAAARKQGIDSVGVDTIVQSYFAAPDTLRFHSTIAGLQGQLEGQAILKAEGTLHVPTTLMKILGQDMISVPIRSRVTRGLGNVEIALVLDTTFSMSEGSRLANMKTAATELIDTLYALPEASTKIKVSLVPFAKYVNVGMANRNASWMDVPADTTSSTTSWQCWDTWPNAVKSNCRMVTYTAYNDGVPYDYTVEECDWDWGTPVNVCDNVTNTTTSTWYGCAGARSNPLNIKDEQYATRIPGVHNVSCPSEILPLTNDPTEIKNAINAMTPNGDTYIPTGLVWGWRTLSNRAPFTQSADDPTTASGNVRKYLVLMTDGENQRSPRYAQGDHEGSDVAAANILTEQACQNIRNDTESKIEIYTIAFQVNDPGNVIKPILQGCATPGGAFYDAVDFANLLTAFGDIGNSVSVARVAQ